MKWEDTFPFLDINFLELYDCPSLMCGPGLEPDHSILDLNEKIRLSGDDDTLCSLFSSNQGRRVLNIQAVLRR